MSMALGFPLALPPLYVYSDAAKKAFFQQYPYGRDHNNTIVNAAMWYEQNGFKPIPFYSGNSG